jgi:hypothetical protein
MTITKVDPISSMQHTDKFVPLSSSSAAKSDAVGISVLSPSAPPLPAMTVEPLRPPPPPLDLELLDLSSETVKFTSHGISIYTEIFHQLDKDKSSYLTYKELNVYSTKTTGHQMPFTTCLTTLKSLAKKNHLPVQLNYL